MGYKGRKRIEIMLNLLFVGILILSSVGYSIFMFRRTDEQYKIRLKETGDEAAKNIRWQMETSLDYIKGMGEVFSNYEDIHCDEALGTLERVGKKSRFSRMWLTKTDGKAISSDGDASDGSGRDYMNRSLKGESGFSEVQTSRMNGKRNVPLFAPVTYNGEVNGVVIGIFDLENLLTMLDIQCFEGEGCCYIYNQSGEILVSNGKENKDIVSRSKYGYSAPVGILDWNVYISFPAHIIAGELRTNIIIMAIMCLIWVVVLAVFITRSFKERNRGLIRSAQLDSLTGLTNRGTAKKIINNCLHKKGKCKSAFIVLDIDKFKAINDFKGHIAGDSILKKLAELMKEYFGESVYLSRLGGDEFGIFIEKAENSEELVKIVDSFRKHVKDCFAKERCESTVSIGIIFSSEKNETFGSLYKKADEEMYESKQKGGNRITVTDK